MRELLAQAGVTVDYRSFDRIGHSMHGQDQSLFADTPSRLGLDAFRVRAITQAAVRC